MSSERPNLKLNGHLRFLAQYRSTKTSGPLFNTVPEVAVVAKLVNAPDLGSGGPQALRVRLPPTALQARTRERNMAKRKRQASGGAPPGPPPDVLKLEGDWREAVRRSVEKKKPARGWPKPPKKKARSKPRP